MENLCNVSFEVFSKSIVISLFFLTGCAQILPFLPEIIFDAEEIIIEEKEMKLDHIDSHRTFHNYA